MPGRSSACAWSFHTLRRPARQEAVLHDLAEQVDRVRIRGCNGHIGPGLPGAGRANRDLELARVEVVGRGVDLGLHLRLTRAGRQIAGDCGLACAGADGIRYSEVVVEDDPELDDSEQ